MLRTRLWMGAILGLLGLGILVVDHQFAPWYPILGLTVLGIGLAAARELRMLLPLSYRPHTVVTYTVLTIWLLSHWLRPILPFWLPVSEVQLGLLGSLVLVIFISEIAIYRTAGEVTLRISATFLILIYIGFLGGCLGHLRFLDGPTPSLFGIPFDFGALALAFAFFVPKAGDIGAYFAGRLLGRHRLAPLISPKKTWEGAIGGFAGAIAATYGLAQLTPLFDERLGVTLAFGIVLAVAGQLGDLAESVIKRDGHSKDASQTVPGFGGVLDVIDSILFAAPVTLAWLSVLVRWTANS